MAEDKPKKEPEALQVMSDPPKLIPKLATKIGGAKTGNTFVLSFMSALDGEVPQMIERISLDTQTVDKLIDLLKELKEIDNGK